MYAYFNKQAINMDYVQSAYIVQMMVWYMKIMLAGILSGAGDVYPILDIYNHWPNQWIQFEAHPQNCCWTPEY